MRPVHRQKKSCVSFLQVHIYTVMIIRSVAPLHVHAVWRILKNSDSYPTRIDALNSPCYFYTYSLYYSYKQFCMLFLIFPWYFITHSYTQFSMLFLYLYSLFSHDISSHTHSYTQFSMLFVYLYSLYSNDISSHTILKFLYSILNGVSIDNSPRFSYALCDVLARNDISSRLRLSARNASQSNADMRTTGHLHWGVPSPSAVASCTDGFLHPQQLPAALMGSFTLSSCQLYCGVPSPSAVANCTDGFLHPQQLPAALMGSFTISSCQLHWGVLSFSAVASCTEGFLHSQQLPAALRGFIILSSCQLHCSM